MRFNSVLISSLFLALRAVPGEAANNWAGVQLNKNAGTFVSVSGHLLVPQVWGKSGSGVAATLTLDDDSHCDNYLQAGMLATVADSGTQYQAFYKWSPDDIVILPDVTVSLQDTVHISISGSSDLISAYVTVRNPTNNQSSSQNVSTGHQLCGQSVGWIVDAATLDGDPASHSNFSTMRFTSAEALDENNHPYLPEGGDILQMRDSDGTGLTYSVANSDRVIVTLYGPE